MKKILMVFSSAILVSLCVNAQQRTAFQEIADNPELSGHNHYVYPYPDAALPQLSPAPEGYEPFYIDHYGRHGSRWSTRESAFSWPAGQLEKAERRHCLTERGRQVLNVLKEGARLIEGRTGELSDKGAEQHRQIAERMCRNFPQVFAGEASVDAKSTVIIRCILSMINETNVLRGFNPQLRLHADASVHDMHFMGWGYGEDTLATALRKRMDHISDSVNALSVHPSRLMATLFSDPQFVADSIKDKRLMRSLFDAAGMLQNYHAFDGQDLLGIFTEGELYDLWRAQNIYWYTHWANAPQNGGRMPFVERALLRDMVATADSMIASGGHGANLRFGHDTCLLPLACLMELGDVNQGVADLSLLDSSWRGYRIFPMAGNVQLVFYRKAGAPVLVKALLNEGEVAMPVATDQFPYYEWETVRAYYLKKLDTPVDWQK